MATIATYRKDWLFFFRVGLTWRIHIGWFGFGEAWYPGVVFPKRGITIQIKPRWAGWIDYNVGFLRFRKMLPYLYTEEMWNEWCTEIDLKLQQLGVKP